MINVRDKIAAGVCEESSMQSNAEVKNMCSRLVYSDL